MQKELEASILGVNKNQIRKKLLVLGATLKKKEGLMRRRNFSLPKEKDIAGTWLRVRDEGDKITLSFKRCSNKQKINTLEELCLQIDNFDIACEFLLSIGAKDRSYQETKRELWLYRGAEITIDTWPGMKPFIEVEGKSEKLIRSIIEELRFDYTKEAVFGSADIKINKELGIPLDIINNHTPQITFKRPLKKYEANKNSRRRVR